MTLAVRRAVPGDIDEVIDVLAEAWSWLKTRGIAQWPDHFSESVIAPTVESGTLFVVDGVSSLVATVTLSLSDPTFWGGRDDAVFVHRRAVRPSSAGIGPPILEWVSQEAKRRGRECVCLDCLSSNVRLRRYYEDLGYRLVGEIDGPAETPHPSAGGRWHEDLSEKRVFQ